MRVIISLIVINTLIYFLSTFDSGFSVVFGLNRLFIDGFYWQILTTMFLHANFTHLLMNMVALFQLGSLSVEMIGAKRFFIIYMVGGLITSLLSMFFIYVFGLNHTLVGASGAISVLIGVVARNVPYYRKGLIVVLLVISFVPLLIGINIGWYAHLFGFGVGWFWRVR